MDRPLEGEKNMKSSRMVYQGQGSRNAHGIIFEQLIAAKCSRGVGGGGEGCVAEIGLGKVV